MNPDFHASVEDAEAAFYDAFNRCDLEALMALWSEGEEVVCIHPGGGRLVGLHAIRDAWKQLFESGLRLRLRVHHGIFHSSPMLAVRSVLQHVVIEGEDGIPPPIIATNVYVRGPYGWRIAMHHASPSPETAGSFQDDTPRVVH
ncbi:nuclear transport factor 2 family protein [Niveibacterium sp. 24ML]|uniref:YybH family protein n=1 Tax=Niveibacterium sp. 24ML TaxID=2985512 RepID=UPI0022704E5B|nr:nuclear transport factor 2 family protein [Niveibacterium sp. 24ML]MCX9155226.1 nuclear transport factor 2 family protein [Niveibacterium sp. 24ML]